MRQWRIVGIVLTAVVAVLALAYYWLLDGDYAVLASGMRPEEAAAVVDALKKEDVAFELKDGGTTILVPAKQLDAMRLNISSQDLPLKGTVGFELFNQSDMGLTDFAQKVNYQRALQGEIARTIMAMDGIAHARVHIALPERSLFRTQRSEPRAAVTLTPKPGVQIDGNRIAGIQRLVAATVPDLALDQVAILNERGQLLTPEFSDIPGAWASESALENNYRDRVMRAIAEVDPRAHVDVKVAVISNAPAANGAIAASVDPGATRDHAIRVVLFERMPLSISQREAIRKSIFNELALEISKGDQLSFSPAPEIAPMPKQIAATSTAPALPAGQSAQDQFMASLTRRWAAALMLLTAIVLLMALTRIRRNRNLRRQELALRIRNHLLLSEGAADAA